MKLLKNFSSLALAGFLSLAPNISSGQNPNSLSLKNTNLSPLGSINVKGRDIEYFTENQKDSLLKKFEDYEVREASFSSEDYTVYRVSNNDVRGWRDGGLYGRRGEGFEELIYHMDNKPEISPYRKEFLEYMVHPSYKKRLSREIFGKKEARLNEPQRNSLQSAFEKRLENVKTTSLNITNDGSAHYNQKNLAIFLDSQRLEENPSIAFHEFTHAAEHGGLVSSKYPFNDRGYELKTKELDNMKTNPGSREFNNCLSDYIEWVESSSEKIDGIIDSLVSFGYMDSSSAKNLKEDYEFEKPDHLSHIGISEMPNFPDLWGYFRSKDYSELGRKSINTGWPWDPKLYNKSEAYRDSIEKIFSQQDLDKLKLEAKYYEFATSADHDKYSSFYSGYHNRSLTPTRSNKRHYFVNDTEVKARLNELRFKACNDYGYELGEKFDIRDYKKLFETSVYKELTNKTSGSLDPNGPGIGAPAPNLEDKQINELMKYVP